MKTKDISSDSGYQKRNQIVIIPAEILLKRHWPVQRFFLLGEFFRVSVRKVMRK